MKIYVTMTNLELSKRAMTGHIFKQVFVCLNAGQAEIVEQNALAMPETFKFVNVTARRPSYSRYIYIVEFNTIKSAPKWYRPDLANIQ